MVKKIIYLIFASWVVTATPHDSISQTDDCNFTHTDDKTGSVWKEIQPCTDGKDNQPSIDQILKDFGSVQIKQAITPQLGQEMTDSIVEQTQGTPQQ